VKNKYPFVFVKLNKWNLFHPEPEVLKIRFIKTNYWVGWAGQCQNIFGQW